MGWLRRSTNWLRLFGVFTGFALAVGQGIVITKLIENYF